MKMLTLRPIMAAIAARDAAAACAAIDAALADETGKAWRRDLGRLRETIADNQPRFKVFAADGNTKLPFLAWSSLPGEYFCKGAGACLKFCYSFKAHRYPAAFARQAQNSWLLGSDAGRAHILAALDTFSRGRAIDFRLYVDGDFSSVADVKFWMAAIAARPWLRAYGYSKAFAELLAYNEHGASRSFTRGVWPSNYLLNLSSGHKHDAATLERVRALPITRGEFIAVDMGRKVHSSDHGNREHNAALRAAFGAKAFTCPGKCGTCTPSGHACGSDKFRGVPIIIAAH